MQAGQEKLWTRTFIVLMGLNLCSALSFYLIMVKIAEFAVDTYDVTQSVAALTLTVYVIAALLTRVLLGGQIDRWGVKRSLAIGSAVNAVAMLLYLLPLNFAMLLVVRAVHGLAFALMSGSAAAGAALVIPRDRYGEGIGYFSMMQALATGVGPFVAILLTSIFGGYLPMFICSAVIGVIALVGVAVVEIPATADDGAPPAPHMHVSKGIGSFVQLSVLPLGAVLFLVYLGYSSILSFVTSYADSRGLTDAVSLYFVVYAVVVLISRPPVGRRVDRKGENSTIYFCFAALVASFVALGFAVNGAILLASAALAGLGIGATQSIIQAVIARDTPPAELGRANSTFLMSLDLGSGVGPVVIGAVFPFLGYSYSYLLLAVVSACAAAVYYFAHGRNH